MEKEKLKKEINMIVDDLPDNTNWNDLMYKIYVHQSIEQGIRDIENGDVIEHEELKNKIADKLRQ